MIGKNLCNLALGALACLSVAFSGNIKDGLKVNAFNPLSVDELTLYAGTYVFNDVVNVSSFTGGTEFYFGFASGVGSYFLNFTSLRFTYVGSGGGGNVSPSFPAVDADSLYFYSSSDAILAYKGDTGWQNNSAYKTIEVLEDTSLDMNFVTWVGNNSTYSAPSSSSVPTYSDGYEDGYSEGYASGQSAGNSQGYSEGYASGQSAGNSQGYGEGYASGQSAGHSQGYSEGYADGYDSGDSAGYSDGYASGYSAGRNQTLDVEQTVSLVWGGNDPIEVTYSYGEYPANPVTLNGSLSRFDLKRSIGSSMIVRVRCSGNYVATTVLIGGVSTRLVPTMVVNDYVYFPTWDNPILVYVTSTSTPFDGGLMPEDFCFDASEYQNVFFGSYNPNAEVFEKGYNEGYNSGYEAGQDAAQSSVYDAGRSDGYAAGYSAGLEAGGGEQNVIDIWGLMSAVITMPFTFFSQGLDWTLFAGSQYEFSVSIFFGSLLVILMLWKIIQLVIGLGK